ncbi:MAG: glucoamylase family protein [Caldimonas sp.]
MGLTSRHARMLLRLQRNSFGYFVHEINRANGLVLDKTRENWPASIAAMGMALAAYPVGVRRKFIGRDEAAQLTLAMLRFLATSEQGQAADATGHKGFYYHFLDMGTGRRAWQSELSSVDTALLIAGVLAAAAFFDGTGSAEAEIRDLGRMLYERVDWAWMLAGRDTLCHGWRPEHGFLPYHWQGYDEALILYLLALGSPTHPIDSVSYDAWCDSYEWKTIYGFDYLYAGPLFTHQLSHIWCDFRGIRDRFMRDHDADYFENSRRATFVQQQYAMRNPLGFKHVGETCWGITASDGPGFETRRVDGIERVFYDYVARGAPYGPDDGTLAPWAVAASLPFAPEIVVPTLANFVRLPVHAANPYGFKASINPVYQVRGDDGIGWVSPYHFGINEGPTVLMIENFRSGLIWSLMAKSAALVAGLRAAGFTGGWLA